MRRATPRRLEGWWQRQPLLRRTIIGYVALILLPIATIGTVGTVLVRTSLIDAALQSVEDQLQTGGRAVSVAATHVEAVTGLLQYNTSFVNYLAGSQTGVADRILTYRSEIAPLLDFIRSGNPFVDDIRLYTRSQTPVGTGSGITNIEDLHPSIANRIDEIGFRGTWAYQESTGEGASSIRYFRVLYDSRLVEPVAISESTIDVAFFADSFASLTSLDGFVMGRSRTPNGFGDDSFSFESEAWIGRTLPHAPSLLARAELDRVSRIDRTPVLIRAITLPNPPLELYAVVPLRSAAAGTHRVVIVLAAGILLLLSLLTWIYYSVSYSLAQRVLAFSRHIKDSSGQQLEPYEMDRDGDEIGVLVREYNQLVERVGVLVNNVRVAEARQKEAKLLALQYQMTPHFLYNALESIRMLAEAGDSERAAEMTYLLGRFSRYSLADDSAVTTLSEEIEHARLFLDIHKARMGSRLEYHIEVAGDARSVECPRFILQPIVENCIKHGFGKRRRGGRVEIGVRVDERSTVVTVEDDGVGPEGNGARQHDDPGHGVGLESVHTRLVGFGGRHSGVTMKGLPGARPGTRVELTIAGRTQK